MSSEVGSRWADRFRPWFVAAIVWIVAFDLVWVSQRFSGADKSEFGEHPDEAAHYITGLMVRDYVAAGFPGKPMEYAEKYSAHYPKIAPAVWPPFYYFLQTAWTLPFGVSRMSVLLLIAAITATLVTFIFVALRRSFGPVLATAGALAFLLLPLVQQYSGMVMTELLCALWMFAATLAFGRFVDAGRARSAIAFGLFSGLAILTKGTGLALVLVPPVVILFTRRWSLLKRPSLWISAVVAAVIAGPWAWWLRSLGPEKGASLHHQPSFAFAAEAAAYYSGKLGWAVGFVLLIFFGFGLAARVIKAREHHGLWTSLAALVLGVFLLQCAFPVALEDRHLISALPAFLCLAAAGCAAIVARSSRGEIFSRAAEVKAGSLLLLGLCAVWATQYIVGERQSKRWSGFAAIAEDLAQQDPGRKLVVLVSSDQTGEGMFISEVAMRENRPGRTIKCANQELARADWSGRAMRPRFRDDEALLAWFAAGNVDYVLIDVSMPEDERGEHHDQLQRVTDEHVSRFWPITRSDIVRDGEVFNEPLILYRVKHVGR